MPVSIISDLSSLTFIRNLTRREETAIEPSLRMSIFGQKFLKTCYEQNQLLICDCNYPPAVMYPIIVEATGTDEADTFLLCSHPRLGTHQPDCHLLRKNGCYLFRSNEQVTQALEKQKFWFEGGSLRFYPAFSHNSEINSKRTKLGHSVVSPTQFGKGSPLLVKLLRFLILKAKANQTALTNEHDVSTVLKGITLAAQNIKFGHSKLADYLFFGDMAFEQAEEKLVNEPEFQFGRRAALCITISDKNTRIFDNNHSYSVVSNSIRLTTKHLMTECRLEDSSAPYLVAYTVAQSSTEGNFEIQECFVKPIADTRSIFPLNSNLESMFVDWMKWFASKSAKHWVLTKPITGDSYQDSFIQPDFILESKEGNDRFLIEVHDRQSTHYEEKKELIVPLLKSYWSSHQLIELELNSKMTSKVNKRELSRFTRLLFSRENKHIELNSDR